MLGRLRRFVWTNANVLAADLAAGKKPYPADRTEYLLDSNTQDARWLPTGWKNLIEKGEWSNVDLDNDEEIEKRWGHARAVDVLNDLHRQGWKPVRELGVNGHHRHGQIDENDANDYEGELSLYLLESVDVRSEAPEVPKLRITDDESGGPTPM